MPESSNKLQFLSCTLGDDLYALPIGRVREVLEFGGVTAVPRTPDFMRGVINLRGKVVPVVDLKLKLGMKRTEVSVDTCVVIIEGNVDGEATVLGLMADSVQEVLELGEDEIGPPPRLGRIRSEFVTGMGRQNDAFLILLDIDKAFATDAVLFEIAAEKLDPNHPITPAGEELHVAASAS